MGCRHRLSEPDTLRACRSGTTPPALIVVDLQNDFADPAGGLSVAGGTTVVLRDQRGGRGQPGPPASVFYTQDWHPESTPHFAKDGGIWPVHCVAGTWGAELHPDLMSTGRRAQGRRWRGRLLGLHDAGPGDGRKTPTELEDLLRARGIEQLAVCGLATDYCVNATARRDRLGFEPVLPEDAIAAVDLSAGDGNRAVDEMRRRASAQAAIEP